MAINFFEATQRTIPDDILDFTQMSATVGFTLKNGSIFNKVGRNGKAYTHRFEQQVITEYTINFPDLCESELTTLQNKILQFKNGTNFGFFDDISDNFVVQYLEPLNPIGAAVEQYGILVPITNTPNHRMVKVYQCGRNSGIKPIYRFSPQATVEVNGSAAGFSLDLDSGIFSGLPTGFHNAECDHYYTLVRVTSPVTYTSYYQRGFPHNIPISLTPSNSESSRQRYKANCTLQEVKRNEILDLPLEWSSPTSIGDIGQLDLRQLTAGMSRSDDFRTRVYEHRGFAVTSNNPTLSDVQSTITVPSNIVKHRDLIYWTSIYRACAGGSFDII
jgi:hypothetical protein